MIKNYQIFFENIQSLKEMNNKIFKLISDIKEIYEYSRDHRSRPSDDKYPKNSGRSYSLLVYNSVDIEEEYWDYISALEVRGWNIKDITTIFDEIGYEYLVEISKKFDRLNSIDLLDGITDLFLYKMSKGKHQLAGYNVGDGLLDGGQYPGDEAIIKYGYGWHKSGYGELALKQSLGENWKDSYTKSVLIGLKAYIIESSDTTDSIYKALKSYCIGDRNMTYEIPNLNRELKLIYSENIKIEKAKIIIDSNKIDSELDKYYNEFSGNINRIYIKNIVSHNDTQKPNYSDQFLIRDFECSTNSTTGEISITPKI